MDDSSASTHHTGATNDDSVIVKTPFDASAAASIGIINAANGAGAAVAPNVDSVVASSGNSFTLQYTETSGAITLTDKTTSKAYTATDAGATKVNVGHLFVTSGSNSYAAWRVCGLGKYLMR